MKKVIKGVGVQFLINLIVNLVRIIGSNYILRNTLELHPHEVTTLVADIEWEILFMLLIIVYNTFSIIISGIVLLIQKIKKQKLCIQFLTGFCIVSFLNIIYVILEIY